MPSLLPTLPKEDDVFAHVISFRAPVTELEGVGMRGFRERVVPVLLELPGFQDNLTLLDRDQGEILGITVWDTEEHARAAAAKLEQERETGVAEMGASSAPGKLYEVLAFGNPASK
jgi:hypothetical protein